MRGRVFVFIIILLIGLVTATSPPILGPFLEQPPTPTATVLLTATLASPTFTPDLFAHVPTATPVGGQEVAVIISGPLPTPALGDPPPTYTAVPTLTKAVAPIILPNTLATPRPVAGRQPTLMIPTPAGVGPDHLHIPHLDLDVPVEPVGPVSSDVAAGVYEWGVPDYRAAGWLETSAPFGMVGNTVLDGHHNIQGEVFRDLWTLRPGDEITLSAGNQSRRYRVDEVLILPERDQPLEVRLANARYIQPTEDERLTLITCWPYNDNSHRAVVIAFPQE